MSMSLAARVMARKAAKETFDFAERQERLTEAQARVAAADITDSATVLIPGDLAHGVDPAPRQPTLAQRHALKTAAAALSANENALEGGAPLTAYENMLIQLHGHRAQLKGIQGTEAKIALKRELLPSYLPWILGRLEAAAEGKAGGQDDVLVIAMIWSIDTGDYKQGLELAQYCRRYNQVLPSHINRDLANFVTEEIAEAALKAYRAGGDAAAAFPGGVLGDVEELFRDDDMFDQVRAKLQKAIGLAILQAAPADTGPVELAPVQRDALTFFKRAQQLDGSSGCVKLIEKIERDLKKLEPATPPAS